MFKLPVQLFFTYIDVFLWPFLIFFLSGLEILQIFTLKNIWKVLTDISKSSGWTEAHFWCCSLNLNIFLHFNFLICDLSCVICVIWVCLCHRREKKAQSSGQKSQRNLDGPDSDEYESSGLKQKWCLKGTEAEPKTW